MPLASRAQGPTGIVGVPRLANGLAVAGRCGAQPALSVRNEPAGLKMTALRSTRERAALTQPDLAWVVLFLPALWAAIGAFAFTGGVTAGAVCNRTACRPLGWWFGIAFGLAIIPLVAPQLRRVTPRTGVKTLDVVVALPWLLAASHQALPYWDDSAHYMNSSSRLFRGSATLAEVSLLSGNEILVQGDFHGPLYLFLHWPFAVATSLGLNDLGASAVTFTAIIILKVFVILSLLLVLKGPLGTTRSRLLILLLFFVPYTRYILAGTHREWFLLYATTIVAVVLTGVERPRAWASIASGLLLAQAHVTALLVFAPMVGIAALKRTARRRVGPIVLGGILGFLPLVLGTLLLGLGRGTGIEVLAQDFGADALRAFDEQRLTRRNLPFTSSDVIMPPLSLFTLGLVATGLASGLRLSKRSSAVPGGVTVFAKFVLLYAAVVLAGFMGLIDRFAAAVGFSASWFSLSKLLSSNDRYWFLLIVALTVVVVAQPMPRPTRSIQRVSERLGLAAAVIAASIPLSAGAFLAIHSWDGSALRLRLLPQAAATPLSNYLDFLAGLTANWIVSGAIVGVIAIALGLAFRTGATATILLSTLAAITLAATPVQTYARGTTAASIRAIEHWQAISTQITWAEGCYLGAQNSTQRLYFDSTNLPVVYVTAPPFAILHGPVDQVLADFSASSLPCGVFEGGLLDWAAEGSIYGTLYSQQISGQGFTLRVDPTRSAVPSELLTLTE